ncbi:hypothetical protein D3C74_49480 [compost metagenome]
MCLCNPLIRTPFCGKPGCTMPPQESEHAQKEESTKTVHINDLQPGTYFHIDGEGAGLKKVKEILASGQKPVLYTMSDQYIQRVLDSLYKARMEGREPEDFFGDDPDAVRVIY